MLLNFQMTQGMVSPFDGLDRTGQRRLGESLGVTRAESDRERDEARIQVALWRESESLLSKS